MDKNQISGYGRLAFIHRKAEGMKAAILMENMASDDRYIAEHGLSIYIETKKYKLLVDTGQSDAFLKNADEMGMDLSKLDMVILSHGHYDHSGGLLALKQMYPNIPVYMQKSANGAYYHKSKTVERYIGIASRIEQLPQIVKIEGNKKIDEQLSLFTGIKERYLWPKGNQILKVKRDGTFYQDDFCHEQYLVIEEEGKQVLISGCAHNGILNILNEYRKIYKRDPDIVISGFHMMKKNEYTKAEKDDIHETGKQLKEMDTIFYTGHCTGERAFEILQEEMGEKIKAIHSGMTMNL